MKLSGFAGPGCEDTVIASGSCKKEDMISFLRKIREKNPEKSIGIVPGNARIHTAEAVKKEASLLKMRLIPMPKYSPGLNPVEYLWKDTKKETAKFRNFDDAIPKIPDIALKIVKERKMSYSEKWRTIFIKDKS